MAVFYLKHPIHGAKVAIAEWEVEHDKEQGWEEFDPAEPKEPEIEKPAENALTQVRRVRNK